MNPELKSLYQEVILDHNRNPRNFRRMDDADASLEGFNPLCGDRYTFFVKMDGERIVDVAFKGSGCAISKASASVMGALLKGKTKSEADAMFTQFHELVTGKLDAEAHADALGKLAAFGGVSEFPARVKCASLPWHTMHGLLESQREPVSTE
jgi:nitrogen fixation NifU-like protein